ncbi:MAG: cobyric acid synthase [Kordiimonadaceae bacterium]|nr:cobyric acid synthase [Kordiimonadaceae bacterium]
MTLSLMLQGTGSDVGKSVLVAGLCRALVKRGMTVRPFKPQNMSNNAAVTEDGGEIGRAQALQAMACGVEPTVHMNPVLLKPQSDVGAQIIVHGKVHGMGDTSYFREKKLELLSKVIESFEILKEQADIVIVEGAGSPAEVNLRENDIANMGFAEATNTPVVLIGDIDRGGVIASIVGTYELLSASEKQLIKGYIINKFRGDVSLFDDALITMTEHTGWQNFGILPFVPAVNKLPAEDAVVLDHSKSSEEKKLIIAVPMLSRIANFDDLDPLILEPDVDVRFVAPGKPLPCEAKLVIIPGTKSTISDLKFFRINGWDIDLSTHVRRGGSVLGICGGYQILGTNVSDPEEIEGVAGTHEGLGLLSIETVIKPEKVVCKTKAYAAHLDCETSGYEIHMGETTGPGTLRPFLQKADMALGAMSEDGRVSGVYLHGLFINDKFRAKFLAQYRGGRMIETSFLNQVETALDILADEMEHHLDIDEMLRMATPVS